jgi:hypothetical protein
MRFGNIDATYYSGMHISGRATKVIDVFGDRDLS